MVVYIGKRRLWRQTPYSRIMSDHTQAPNHRYLGSTRFPGSLPYLKLSVRRSLLTIQVIAIDLRDTKEKSRVSHPLVRIH